MFFLVLLCQYKIGYTYLKNKISGNSSFFANLDELKEENDKLKKENSELEKSLRELEIIKAENETMKEYLGLAAKYSSYETVPAYIVSKDISNYSDIFIINVGKEDGIEEYMTVIADEGLVRICRICNGRYSKGADNN